MDLKLLIGGDFSMPPKKGQKFIQYTKKIKTEAVRLRVEERWSYSMIPNLSMLTLHIPNYEC